MTAGTAWPPCRPVEVALAQECQGDAAQDRQHPGEPPRPRDRPRERQQQVKRQHREDREREPERRDVPGAARAHRRRRGPWPQRQPLASANISAISRPPIT
jgi:hypothetical protein